MQHVIAITHVGGHRLRVRFDDGVEGVVDFAKLLKFRGELVEPLRDRAYFARAFIHPEARVVTWPNGMDVCNLVLYSKVTGCSVRSLLTPVPVDSPAARSPRRARAKSRGRSGSKRRPKASRRAAARPKSHR